MDLNSSAMPVPENCTTPTSRPTVPPKPKSRDEKDTGRSGTKSSIGTQVHFVRKTSPGRKISHCFSSPINRNGSDSIERSLSPNNVEVVEVFKENSSFGSERSRSLSISAIKPALPPKPTASALLSPRKGILSHSPDSKQGKTSPTTIQPDGKIITDTLPSSGCHRVATQKFDLIDELTDLNNSNPTAHTLNDGNTILQPVTNLNQSKGLGLNKLNQSRFVQPHFSPLTELQKSEARKKTTSLGRNFDLSTACTPGRNSTHQFFRASPLDLSSSTTSRPRSMDHFGRPISFAPNSPLPPPPPPRIKRKFSSTSPGRALQPESPPPNSPPPVYAKIDKEKKWEERRRKKGQELLDFTTPQSKVDETQNGTDETQINEKLLVKGRVEQFDHSLRVNNCVNSSHDEVCETQAPAINSWLGTYIEKTEDSLDSAGEVLSTEKKGNDLISSEQIQNIIDQCIKTDKSESQIGISDDEDLTPTGEKLPENKSFLFLHIEKELGLKETTSEINQKIVNSNESHDPLSDESFENICETQLESIDVSEEFKGNTDKSKDGREITSVSGQNTSEPAEIVLNLEAGKLMQSVDSKILTLQSLLSTISNGSLETCVGQSMDRTMDAVQLNEENLDKHNQSTNEFFSNTSQKTADSESSATEIECASSTDKTTDADLVNEIIYQKFPSHYRRDEKNGGKIDDTTDVTPVAVTPVSVQLLKRDSFRRRSWNCSENTSSTTSGSSPSSSSSSIRDRAGSMTNTSGWLDTGDSTGALGDTENSDVSTQIISPASLRPYPGSGGSLSRRKRTMVTSIFSSFGKSMGSSSGSNSPGGSKPKRNQKVKLFSKDVYSPPKKNQIQRPVTEFSDVVVSAATTGQLSHWSTGSSGSPQVIPTPPKKTVSMPPLTNQTRDELYQRQHSQAHISDAGSFTSTTTGILDDEDGDKAEICSITSNISIYDDILADLTQKEKKAFYVARELLTSERTFVDVLNLLTIDFPYALRQAGEINRQQVISDADLKIILGELPSLKNMNIILLDELEERIRNWKSNPKVADIIVKTGPFLKHYSSYIKDFERISRFFGECRQRNPKFSKTVMDFESSDRCQKLCLMHYMLKPVQRMPLYPLLLEDYLKYLDRDSADFADTVKAITIVREVAEHANEAIRLQANADKLIQLQNRLNHSVILKPDRQLITEGELQKVCRKELQPRYFALMNDCLLCMTYNTSTGSNRDLKLRYELPLTGMQISLSSSEDYPNEFTVISTTRSFNLLARSGKEREGWMKALNLAIRNNIKKRSCSTPDMDKEFELGKVAPVWIQDSRVTMCQVCTAEFTIYFRRHHCRACGKVVCGNCSRNEAPLHYNNLEAARVCDDCYQFLLEEFDKENQQNHSGEIETIRSRFKKAPPKVAKPPRRCIPTRLEVNPSAGSQVSGYLNWRDRRSWKRRWFVLSDRVLLVCAASEDVVALKSIPILGYDVEIGTEKSYEGVDGQLIFKLTHSGQSPMVFQAENKSSLEKWVGAMKEATVLT